MAATGPSGVAPAVGRPVRLAVQLSSDAGCQLSAGAVAGARVRIRSGSDTVWDTTSCPLATAPAVGAAAAGRAIVVPASVTVAPSGTADLYIVWPAVRLASGCAAAPAALGVGTYVASVRLPGAPTATATFTLR